MESLQCCHIFAMLSWRAPSDGCAPLKPWLKQIGLRHEALCFAKQLFCFAVMSPEILPLEVVDGGFAMQQDLYAGESHEHLQRHEIAL